MVIASTKTDALLPKLAVFYHFVLLGTAKVTPVSEKDVLEVTHHPHAGPLIWGEDLITFRIGRDAVEQIQPIALLMHCVMLLIW